MPSRWEFFKARMEWWAFKAEQCWYKLTKKCIHCGQRNRHKMSCYGDEANKWFAKNANTRENPQ